MKLRYAAALIMLLTACKQDPKLDLTVKAAGVTDGVVILKQANEIVANEALKNGELHISRQLQAPGYYTLSVIDNNKPVKSETVYDIYLQNGSYVIEPNFNQPDEYPAVTTSSQTQKELSEYYQLAHKYAYATDKKIDSLTRFLQSGAAVALAKQKRAMIYTDTRMLQKERRGLDLKILKAYIQEHPTSTIGAHIMAQQYFAENPAGYNEVFQKFPQEVKTSDDGLKISNKLGTLLKQFAGADAPEITGNTPAGKPFDRRSIKKDIIVVEFWKPSSDASDLSHKRLVQGIILTPADKAKTGFVSVAIEDKPGAWLNSIKGDKVTWPQVSDNKGDASPNVTNWEIKSLPVYFLVDRNWKMVKANIEFGRIDTEVHDYLTRH